MSVVSEQERDRIEGYEEDIKLLRENYYQQKDSDKDKAYLDKVAAEIAQYEAEFSGLVASLNARKDRNYIFFEANTPKNTEINAELNRIKALQDVVKGIKSNIDKFLEDNIEKPKRMEEARGEIIGRERARNAMLESMEPAAQTLRRQAQDNFTRGFKTEPLDREEALRLVRLEEGLDKLRMAGVDANILKRGAQEVQNVVKDAVAASEIVGAETFYTAGNTVALLLGWWIILPMKAVSFASDIVSRGFRATEAFFQTLNEYAHKQADQSGIPGKIGWGTVRLLTGAVTLAAAAVKGATRLISDLFDVDKMIRKGNMGAAFGFGFVGAAVLVTFAIASVFSFGIPIAMIAVGAGLAAAVGLAKVGIEYTKFKETRAARRNFQLTPGEEARLLEFEQRNPKFREGISREIEAKLHVEGQAQRATSQRQLERDHALAQRMQAEMNAEPKLSKRERREQARQQMAARHENRARTHADRLAHGMGSFQDATKFKPGNVVQPRASGEPWSSRLVEEPKHVRSQSVFLPRTPKEDAKLRAARKEEQQQKEQPIAPALGVAKSRDATKKRKQREQDSKPKKEGPESPKEP